MADDDKVMEEANAVAEVKVLDKETSLSFVQHSLKSVPELHSGVISVNLSRNYLRTFESSCGMLYSLRSLYLGANNLTEVPPCLESCAPNLSTIVDTFEFIV